MALITAPWALGAPSPGKCRSEGVPVPGGAELVTMFCPSDGGEMPVFSVLVDTLGSAAPGARRLSKVWVFSYARPSLLQRAQALFPVFFPGPLGRGAGTDSPPAPVADLSSASHQTWRRIAAIVTQAEVLDVRGALIRASSRTYLGNTFSYKQMKIAEALSAMDDTGVASDAGLEGPLSRDEWRELHARLALSARLLGGLVSDERLSSAWARMAAQEQERRGHNWELLRQRVEANGLYFEPLEFGATNPAGAVVWLAQSDLETPGAEGRFFDRSFLGFANPWTDPGLRQWKGYEETWYLDPKGRRCAPEDGGARAVTMIPLAVYSLSYPRAPLLLVDFRNAARTHSREVTGRVANYVALGVFGLTGFASWEYTAGHAAWQWYRQRHGAATDQAERLNAYAELRLALLMGSGLDPELRDSIARRVNAVPLTPFGESVNREVAVATSQYQALLRYAACPADAPACVPSLEERISRDRGREMVPLVHGRPARVLFTAGAILTAGLYRHREPATPALLAELTRQRRTRYLVAKLEKVVNSGPEIDTAWDSNVVNGYLDELSELQVAGRDDKKVAGVLERVFAKTTNEETRLRCLNCLARRSSPESRRTLSRLIDRGGMSEALLRAAEMLETSGASVLTANPDSEPASPASFGSR
ncbi:MAG TPA: hypothetical protein VHD76_08640 [Bryobacteraceae bacterium]|jgi:hypothetical protein|nr:hypothetical protein [Bryobacteraceae bacterium]